MLAKELSLVGFIARLVVAKAEAETVNGLLEEIHSEPLHSLASAIIAQDQSSPAARRFLRWARQ